ncbi:MAG TPA: hypothetical protein PLD82_08300, partial [Spirochaetota bacterium]|nr:hypothetical protein [Spirochaetota bacterium]
MIIGKFEKNDELGTVWFRRMARVSCPSRCATISGNRPESGELMHSHIDSILDEAAGPVSLSVLLSLLADR